MWKSTNISSDYIPTPGTISTNKHILLYVYYFHVNIPLCKEKQLPRGGYIPLGTFQWVYVSIILIKSSHLQVKMIGNGEYLPLGIFL